MWHAIQSFDEHECLPCLAERAVVKDIIFAEECWPSAEGRKPGCAEKHVQHSEAGWKGLVWPPGVLPKLAPCRLACPDQSEAINIDMLYSVHQTVCIFITGPDNKNHVSSFNAEVASSGHDGGCFTLAPMLLLQALLSPQVRSTLSHMPIQPWLNLLSNDPAS